MLNTKMNRLFTIESFSKNIRVLLTRSGLSLGQRIKDKLKELNKFEIVACQNPAPDLIDAEPFDIVIHLVGFDPPSFAETLYHTSILHQLLDLCLKHKAKFVLVTSSENTALKEVAISLVRQFNKLFAVNFELVEVGLKDDYDLIAMEVIKKFVHKSQQIKLKKAIDPIVKKPEHEKVTPTNPKISRNIAYLLATAILFVLIILLYQWSWSYFIQCSLKALDFGNWKRATSCATVAKYFPKQKDISNLVIDIAQVGESGMKIVSGKSEDLGNFTGLLSYAQERIAETILNVEDESVRAKLNSYRSIVKRLRIIVDDMPTIMGLGKSTDYLVLLQDTQELRPTGGFIDGLGLLTVSGGKVDSVQLLTSYTADGLLKGTVNTPSDLQLALGESSWYVRDSNWNPSFPKSAEQAAWFIQKQLGKSPQIVVGLNTRTMSKILKIVGPVTVDGLSQKIDYKNIFDIGLTTASADLTKRSIYLGVFQSLLAKFQELSQSQFGSLAAVILEELDNRQLFVSGVNGTRLPNFKQNGWDGDLVPTPCPGVTVCVTDTVHVVSGNTGINKANAKINESLTLDVSLKDDIAQVSVNLSITNKAVVNAWPLGNYKNYLRFYLPASAKISTVVVNNKVISESELQITQTADFLIVGTLINVPVNSTLDVGLNFSRNLPNIRRFVYSLNIPNQAGVGDGPLSVAIRYPTNWLSQAHQTTQVVASGLFRYNGPINKPFKASFDFLKNE